MKGLKPFFTYYGGKWRAAPRYPAPEYPHIIEPFAGSAGYSVRHPERQVLLVDTSPYVVGVWDYLIHASEQEVANLPLEVTCVDELTVCQEARWLIGFWLNKGTAAPCKRPSKWMRTTISPTQFWSESIRDRLTSQLKYIRHWRVSQASYDQMDPTTPATWFVDSPYQGADGRHYPGNPIDFSYLADWCKRLVGQPIVCEQEGADWLPFRPLGTFKATAGRRRTGSVKEVIWP